MAKRKIIQREQDLSKPISLEATFQGESYRKRVDDSWMFRMVYLLCTVTSLDWFIVRVRWHTLM